MIEIPCLECNSCNNCSVYMHLKDQGVFDNNGNMHFQKVHELKLSPSYVFIEMTKCEEPYHNSHIIPTSKAIWNNIPTTKSP